MATGQGSLICETQPGWSKTQV